MIKAYYNRYTTIINGKEYFEMSGIYLKEEFIPEEETITVDWNNLNKFYAKYGSFLPFNIWRFKSGMTISFFESSLFDRRTWDIKEKKNPNFSFKFIVEPVEDDTVTIDHILHCSNADLAIQYLTERNLKITK